MYVVMAQSRTAVCSRSQQHWSTNRRPSKQYTSWCNILEASERYDRYSESLRVFWGHFCSREQKWCLLNDCSGNDWVVLNKASRMQHHDNAITITIHCTTGWRNGEHKHSRRGSFVLYHITVQVLDNNRIAILQMTPYGMLDLHEMHSFHSIAPRGYHTHAAAADIVDDKKIAFLCR